MNKIVLVNFNK